MMRRSRTISMRCVAIAAAMAAVVGAFVAPASAQSSSSSCKKPSGAPVKIGVISSDTTATGPTQDMSEPVNRWAASVNKVGGVGCHPVQLIYRDDAGDAAKSNQAFQDIKNAGAVVIFDNSSVDQSWATAADAAKIPVIGGLSSGTTPIMYKDANFFPTSLTQDNIPNTFISAAVVSKHPKMALMTCSEFTACSTVAQAIKQQAPSQGAEVAYLGTFGASDPNYTAQCLAGKNSGANFMVVGTTSLQASLRMVDECAQQQFTPLLLLGGLLASPDALKDPNVKQGVALSTVIPDFAKTPAVAVYNKVMKGFTPLDPTASLRVWVGLQGLAAAGTKVSATPTSQDFYDGLYAFKGNTLNGLTGPLTYVQGQPTSLPCSFFFLVKDGKKSTPYGTKAQCPKGSSAATTTTKK